jgi:hypothetical protein
VPVPPYADLIAPSSTADGLITESLQERILSCLAMLAGGKAPDGTPLPTATTYSPTIPGIVTDGVTDNYALIQSYLNALTPGSGKDGTAYLPLGPIAISLPIVPPVGTELSGTGIPPQSLDSGPPLPRIDIHCGSQIVPTANWQGAIQAGHTTVSSASNATSLPQATINVGSTAVAAHSPAFTSSGYVLIETIPIGGPGTYGGGWNLVQYTSTTSTTLAGCTLPNNINAGNSQMFTGFPVVQANLITGCTVDPTTNIATITATNTYYTGQPVIVMALGFVGVYQPQGVFEVLATPSPTSFQIQLQGTPTGSFSASGSATAPYDALICLANPSAQLSYLMVNGGTTVSRSIAITSQDVHLNRCFILDGIVAAIDSDCLLPANCTRSDFLHVYVEMVSSPGAALLWWGNNLRATNLYKTNGTLYTMGGACTWNGGHIAGGSTGSCNVYLGNSDTFTGVEFDSLPNAAVGLFTIAGRPSNPNVNFSGCKFYNSNPVSAPVFHSPTTGAQGITLSGDCTIDSSALHLFTYLLDNPSAQDEVLDGFSTSATSSLGVTNPLFPVSPGSSGLSYPGGYFGSVLCGGVPVRGSVMTKITGNVSITNPNTETAIVTATVGVGLYHISAQASIGITGGVTGNYETCDLYISSGAASGTAVFSMAAAPGVTAISSGVSLTANNINTPYIMPTISGEISVTTAGTIVLCAFSTATGTVNHLSPTHNLGGVTNFLLTPVGV